SFLVALFALQELTELSDGGNTAEDIEINAAAVLVIRSGSGRPDLVVFPDLADFFVDAAYLRNAVVVAGGFRRRGLCVGLGLGQERRRERERKGTDCRHQYRTQITTIHPNHNAPGYRK